tara:strand:+ start:1174 stop:1431 length:258 start_codon:yes stop_codon:yes gene_type:complete
MSNYYKNKYKEKKMNKIIGDLAKNLNLTEIFKGKGDLKRWSAKRTIGGVIVTYALASMNGSIEPWGVLLCFIGVLPLCLSFLEKD